MPRLRRIEFGENERMAWASLREHKVRSFLTVLGVVIGVCALVIVASVLVGVDQDMRDYLSDYGTETLFVFKFNPGIHIGRLTAEERSRKSLTLEDALTIRNEAPHVREVVAEVMPRFEPGRPASTPPTIRYKGNEVFGIEHTGALPSYEQVYNVHMAEGRFYNEADNLHKLDVVVIGYDLKDALFPNEAAIGKNVLVAGVNYEVIGVLDKRKGTLMKDNSADKQVLVPYETYRRHHPADDEHFLGVQAYPGMKAEAEDEVRGILRRRRNVAYDKADNFGISSAEQVADQFRQIMSMIALLIFVVSSIGLLVGGVGVMNIMLMSVTERTREIGVRKAIGARKRDVIRQFLTEAVALTGAGGAIGIIFGVLISLLIQKAMNFPSVVPTWAVAAAVAVSMSVGLFFGIYPAVKAARLDPVEALRYE